MAIRNLRRGISLALEERRRLRSPTSLNIAIADRFAQLNEAAWSQATAGGMQPLLKLVEAEAAPEFTPFKAVKPAPG